MTSQDDAARKEIYEHLYIEKRDAIIRQEMVVENIRNAAGRALIIGALIVSVMTGLASNTDELHEGCIWVVLLLVLVGLCFAGYIWLPRKVWHFVGRDAKQTIKDIRAMNPTPGKVYRDWARNLQETLQKNERRIHRLHNALRALFVVVVVMFCVLFVCLMV